jgi:hypothetical protein
MSERDVPYTPGPWSICQDRPNQICPPGSAIPVARVELMWGAMAAANARLISSAPELVEVLMEILDRFADRIDPGPVRRARAVIAKARGVVPS